MASEKTKGRYGARRRVCLRCHGSGFEERLPTDAELFEELGEAGREAAGGKPKERDNGQ